MNNETLPFVDLVRAAVTIISLKADFNFLRCGFHQIIRSKSRAIRTHDCDAHAATGLVHDPAKRITRNATPVLFPPTSRGERRRSRIWPAPARPGGQGGMSRRVRGI